MRRKKIYHPRNFIIILAVLAYGLFFKNPLDDGSILKNVTNPVDINSYKIGSTSNLTKNEALAKSAKGDLTKLLPSHGELFVKINNNTPNFSPSELSIKTYELYSPLDELGRVGVANAILGPETEPKEHRGDISQIHPSGWRQRYYQFIKGGVLYNRSHLIAFKLAGENANALNLMTGTRQLNQSGMTTFESMVSNYIKDSGHHVRYRVTPHFSGQELVARGVQIEALSIEDDKLSFNVYIFNRQEGISIDYLTGESKLSR